MALSRMVYMIVINIASFVLSSNARNTLNCEVTVTKINEPQVYASLNPDESIACCEGHGNSICSTFSNALDSLTSGTMITINVTKELELSSIKLLKNLQSVAITGHNNPTVVCKNGGRLKFSSCHDCRVEGITWVGCGTSGLHDQPAILFYNSSNVTVQNCSFMQSGGPAVVLSEISGCANINHCKFKNTTQYKGHSVSMHYSSGTAETSELVFMKNNYCEFSKGKVISISCNSQPNEDVVQLIKTSNSKDVTQSSKYGQISDGLPLLKINITGGGASGTHTMSFSASKLSVEDRIPIHVMLSPCHPGFWYNPHSQMCECFDHSVVFCSGSTSMIQRGYWFGEVDKKATVAICPLYYCNFTSCDTSINLCHLSPERANQCKSHRSGTACSECKNGYTLPFYSTECINEDNCTVLQTVIVVVLTVVYWIALVIAVLIAAYYKINVGYLYAVTYYYSMVDILLSKYFYLPNGFYIIINFLYSIFKLTPQFLGKLCLVRGLSGIDQQFIHYVHPLAVSFMLVMIVVLARFSHRLSIFISRGIIRVICFLFLLSYTLMTVTSLFLIWCLKFSDVDKIYTYLSPDIEYFQGRHLAYGIIASLCIIFIVIGVPLILIAEPCLSHKIRFPWLRLFLDQLQGCYKDKYCWFAGYYMICRIVIVIIMIIFSPNDFTFQYMLITICTAVAVIHISVRPYKHIFLNVFDALLLLKLIVVPIFLLAKVINSSTVVPITLVLLVFPLIIFLVLYLLIHKDAIMRLYVSLKYRNVSTRNYDNFLDSPASNDDVDLIIDDITRLNATACDM